MELVQDVSGANGSAKAVLTTTAGDQAEETDSHRGLELYEAAVVPVSAETVAPIDDGAGHIYHKLTPMGSIKGSSKFWFCVP